MKKSLILFTLPLALTLLSGCEALNTVEGKGEVITKEYELEDAINLNLNHLVLETGLTTLQLHEADTRKVVITAQENLIPHFTVNVMSNKLSIYGSMFEHYSTEFVHIDIYGYKFSTVWLSKINADLDGKCLDIENFKISTEYQSNATIKNYGTNEEESTSSFTTDISGASTLTINSLYANDINFKISGSSRLETTNINTTTLNLDVSGHSLIYLDGAAKDKVTINVKGVSVIDGHTFTCKRAHVFLEEQSIVSLDVTESLTANLNGGSIYYYVTEEIQISKWVSGNSKIQKYEEEIVLELPNL